MSPFEINFLLHCYARADQFENIDAPIMPEIIGRFREENLIVQTEDGLYKTTNRGSAHVQQLMDLPLPELAYVNGDKILIRMPQ